MDVRCSTCKEPFEVDYLWNDVINETDLTDREVKVWLELPAARKLDEPYRRKFAEAGWEFGNSVINVIHCSACPDDAKPDTEAVRIKAELEILLGDDEDGLAAALEDLGL